MEVLQQNFEVQTQANSQHEPTVLIIDDERDMRKTITEILQLYGFKVYSACNGKEGVEIFKQYFNSIDLVFLDMRMPVMDGRQAFHELRAIDPNQNIVIVTGYADFDDLDDVLRKGAKGFLKKPFRLYDIASQAKNIVGVENS